MTDDPVNMKRGMSDRRAKELLQRRNEEEEDRQVRQVLRYPAQLCHAAAQSSGWCHLAVQQPLQHKGILGYDLG